MGGIKNNRDKLLVVDLCRIFVYSPAFSDELIEKCGQMSLSDFWDFSKNTILVEEAIKSEIKSLFHKKVFSTWKEHYQKDFLKQKRLEEKEKKIYAKPYIDYLDSAENFLFSEFYQNNQIALLTALVKEESLSDPDLKPYIDAISIKIKNQLDSLALLKKTLLSIDFDSSYLLLKSVRNYEKLDRPLLGNYPHLKRVKIERDLASSFYPIYGYGYNKSYAYRQATPLGSIFKIVVAYSALNQHYKYLESKQIKKDKINPLTIIDTVAWDRKISKEGSIVVAYSEEKRPYPRYYKGGRLPKSAHGNIGKIDIIQALAQSSNPYFAILAGDYINSVDDLLEAAYKLNIGRKTNIDLPGEIKGNLPSDLHTNRTGLYSFAIGQHSLITTPLQTAIMLSYIANGSEILKPQIILKEKEIIAKESLAPSIRNTILEGLDQTLWGEKGGARASVIKKLNSNLELLQKFTSLKHELIGKTSTTEIMYRPDISATQAEKYKHIWFGGILLNKKEVECVIVVYLQFGDGGKEAAPIAAEIAHKYRELKKKYSK